MKKQASESTSGKILPCNALEGIPQFNLSTFLRGLEQSRGTPRWDWIKINIVAGPDARKQLPTHVKRHLWVVLKRYLESVRRIFGPVKTQIPRGVALDKALKQLRAFRDGSTALVINIFRHIERSAVTEIASQ
jgi:hypothetical protein